MGTVMEKPEGTPIFVEDKGCLFRSINPQATVEALHLHLFQQTFYIYKPKLLPLVKHFSVQQSVDTHGKIIRKAIYIDAASILQYLIKKSRHRLKTGHLFRP